MVNLHRTLVSEAARVLVDKLEQTGDYSIVVIAKQRNGPDRDNPLILVRGAKS
jgi:hypothetical protein